MGSHICEYCDDPASAATSSGDVLLVFQSGRAYIMPDMVSHYVEEHGWRPPSSLVADVMTSELVEGNHEKKKSQAVKTGYLKGSYDAGGVPPAFALRLRQFIEKAQKAGNRTQMRSA